MTNEEIKHSIDCCTVQYDKCDKCACNKLSRKSCREHLLKQAGVLIENLIVELNAIKQEKQND